MLSSLGLCHGSLRSPLSSLVSEAAACGHLSPFLALLAPSNPIWCNSFLRRRPALLMPGRGGAIGALGSAAMFHTIPHDPLSFFCRLNLGRADSRKQHPTGQQAAPPAPLEPSPPAHPAPRSLSPPLASPRTPPSPTWPVLHSLAPRPPLSAHSSPVHPNESPNASPTNNSGQLCRWWWIQEIPAPIWITSSR